RTGTVPLYVSYLGFGDSVLQMLVAVGMILVILEEDQAALRDTRDRLGESEDRFRLVFEHGGVGMALLTQDGRFLEVNPALVKLLGYDAQELQGRRLGDLGHPDDPDAFLSPTERGLAVPAEKYERERRYLHRDGSTVWARVVRVPLRDAA